MIEPDDRALGGAGLQKAPLRIADLPEATSDTAPANTGTLGKAMAVVEAIAAADEPLRFRDLTQIIDQPPGTLHRQISNLIDEGMVDVLPDQRYTLGLRFLKLAAKTWGRNQFRQVAEPHLRQLHEDTGETVHLGVLQGLEVIYLDKVESRQSVRMHSQIGNASPCYCTGVGKAALAMLPDDERHARISQIRFNRFTPQTINSKADLAAELEAIRSTGIAFDNEEHETGIHCVAAPVHSADRSFVAGVSVTAPVYRIGREKLEEWSDLVSATALAIMDDMKIRMGPRA